MGKDEQGVVTFKTSANSAKVNMIEKSCTVDLVIVDAVLLPNSTMANALG